MVTIISMLTFQYSYIHGSMFQTQIFYKEHHPLKIKIRIHNIQTLQITSRKCDQHNTTQHNTTQHNTTQHNTTQHNTTQTNFNMIKLDLVDQKAISQQIKV